MQTLLWSGKGWGWGWAGLRFGLAACLGAKRLMSMVVNLPDAEVAHADEVVCLTRLDADLCMSTYSLTYIYI